MKTVHRPALALLAALLWSTIGNPFPAQAAEPLSLASALPRTLWALLIVAGLILVLYGLSKKRLSLLGKTGTQAITVLELRPLQAKTTLALVEVRGREFLLGVSGEQVNLLAELSAPGDTNPTPFATVLAEQKS